MYLWVMIVITFSMTLLVKAPIYEARIPISLNIYGTLKVTHTHTIHNNQNLLDYQSAVSIHAMQISQEKYQMQQETT